MYNVHQAGKINMRAYPRGDRRGYSLPPPAPLSPTFFRNFPPFLLKISVIFLKRSHLDSSAV